MKQGQIYDESESIREEAYNEGVHDARMTYRDDLLFVEWLRKSKSKLYFELIDEMHMDR